ncbi:drug/metabolite transporter (DMT)-like permease [Rhodoligotrophos appendicifer]|uniref:DMT family transporter n=1 Tax=Rhodoligotrophos appendicifer TaxID=987056 RepID=UPI0011857E11|nr:DMT family transporter [Rhodoligotrophos appendicifer]
MKLSTPSARPLHLAGVLILAVFWGLNWPAVKIVLNEISPWTFRAIALTLAGLALAVTALIRGDRLSVSRREIAPLLLAGLLTIAGFNLFLAYAQLLAPTSRAVIVTFTMPVWAVIFARIFLAEPLSWQRLVGVGLGVAGLAALSSPLVASGGFSIGLLFALCAGISWALGSVVTKKWAVAAAPLTIATWQLLTGAAFAIGGMLLFEGVPVYHPLAESTLLALAYHVVVALILAYVLWFTILPRLPLGLASLGTLLVPAIGVASAMLILGERPTPMDYAGLFLITLAAFSILLPSRPVPT